MLREQRTPGSVSESILVPGVPGVGVGVREQRTTGVGVGVGIGKHSWFLESGSET